MFGREGGPSGADGYLPHMGTRTAARAPSVRILSLGLMALILAPHLRLAWCGEAGHEAPHGSHGAAVAALAASADAGTDCHELMACDVTQTAQQSDPTTDSPVAASLSFSRSKPPEARGGAFVPPAIPPPRA